MDSSGASFPALAQAASGAWFQSLPPALQQALHAQGVVQSLPSGQRLFGRGDAPDGLYCILRGGIRITGLMESGAEVLLAVLESPQWFGEISLFDQAPRTHDAWAEGDTQLLHVPQAAIERLLEAHPAHWRHFGRLLTQKIRLLFETLEDTALLSPTQRVARRLASMAAGYGGWTDRSVRVIRLSQEQLAQMLSLSRQTVNQSLKALEQAQTLRRTRGAIEILDLAALQNYRP